MKVLLTGGAGYIGSHTAVELLNNNYEVVIIDNLINSSVKVIKRIEKITNKKVVFYKVDIRDAKKIGTIFEKEKVDAVIHFAGLKAVGESVQKPLEYYDNNVYGSLVLFECMREYNINNLVFSSSATVYGQAEFPYNEKQQTGIGITSPYGKTKFMIEEIMKDIAVSHKEVSYVALRYFNPVGAHESGLIGENPQGIPNNLMPFISQTAIGTRQKLSIFGNDYPTPDGTCVRDFIHVVDLAKGHLAALKNIKNGFDAINLGSGKGTSVLQLLTSFEKVTKKHIPYEISERRSGDLPEFYADADKAFKLLSWHTEKTIDDMCKDTWKWQINNPNGY